MLIFPTIDTSSGVSIEVKEMQTINFSKDSIHCQNCAIKNICLTASLSDADLTRFDNIVQHPKALQKSDTLFYAAEKLSSVYAIRKGSIKTFNITHDGEEQITGFHHAGEILGIDALAHKKHHSFAKALETTEVCALPYEALDSLASKVPELHTQLMNVMSTEISKQYDLMMNLNQRTAKQKVAGFLLSLNNKNEFSEVINLNMTRSEIGNYLGLALETVSRIFSKLKQKEIIDLNCKKVRILDIHKLKELAGQEDSYQHLQIAA